MLTPNVPFVPINIIISQYRPVLVLKRHFAMMSVLVFNVTHNAINIGKSDREGTVSGLPVKITKIWSERFDPFGRARFQLLHEL